jgi:hypothetical protein
MSDTIFTAEEQKKHRQTLIEALRSGEYTQTFYVSEWYDEENDTICYCASGLAWHLKTLAGVRGQSMDYYGWNLLDLGHIVRMNDSGSTFPMIADWIEETFQ